MTAKSTTRSTTEKEAYAIIHAVDVFRPYLYGRPFLVFTDHRPLEWLMSKKDPSGRLARWALKLQEYQIEIGYRPGKKNQNADFLSRIPVNSILSIKLKIENWSVDQLKDTYCSKIIEDLKAGKGVFKDKFDLIDGELFTVDGRVIVPSSRKQEVLAINHDHMLSGHLGIEKTYSRLKRQYKWPGMKKDIAEYVNSCLECNRRKPYGATKHFFCPLKRHLAIGRG